MKVGSLRGAVKGGFGFGLNILSKPEETLDRLLETYPDARWAWRGKALVALDPKAALELLPVKGGVTRGSIFSKSLLERFPEVVFFMSETNDMWKQARKPMNGLLVKREVREAYWYMFYPIVEEWLSGGDMTFSYDDVKSLTDQLLITLVAGQIPISEGFFIQLFEDFEELISLSAMIAPFPSIVQNAVWIGKKGPSKLDSLNERLGELIDRAKTEDPSNVGPFLKGVLSPEYDMTRYEIIGALLALIVATSDTTPTTLCWVINDLATNNGIQEDIRSQLVGLNLFDEITGLKPLSAMIDDSMINNVILSTIPRFAGNDIELSTGEIIAKGTNIYVPLRVIHSAPDAKNAGLGTGATKCPGGVLAYNLMMMVIWQVLEKGTLTQIAEGTPVQDQGQMKALGYKWGIISQK